MHVKYQSYLAFQKLLARLKFQTELQNYAMTDRKKTISDLQSQGHNKRPMGHIAHLRKQFKSMNTYDYIITLIKRRKKNIIDFK